MLFYIPNLPFITVPVTSWSFVCLADLTPGPHQQACLGQGMVVLILNRASQEHQSGAASQVFTKKTPQLSVDREMLEPL